MVVLKDHYAVLQKKFKWSNMYVCHNYIKELFSEENKVSRTLFEARKGGRVR